MTKQIAVLDFSNYEVKVYRDVELPEAETEDEAVDMFLTAQGHRTDEVQFMCGDEYIEVIDSNN